MVESEQGKSPKRKGNSPSECSVVVKAIDQLKHIDQVNLLKEIDKLEEANDLSESEITISQILSNQASDEEVTTSNVQQTSGIMASGTAKRKSRSPVKLESASDSPIKSEPHVTCSCPECGKQMRDAYSLKRHLATHMNLTVAEQNSEPMKQVRCRNFRGDLSCPECGKTFRDNHDLKRHVNIHTKSGQYKCSVCTKNFVTESDRARHERTHLSQRPFKCGACAKSFVDKSGMTKHFQRVHTFEKPWECCECAHSFSSKSELQRHLRQTHTDDRPFRCVYCEKRFAMRGTLNMHLKQHLRIPETVRKKIIIQNTTDPSHYEEQDPIFITVGGQDGDEVETELSEDGEVLLITLDQDEKQTIKEEILVLDEQEIQKLDSVGSDDNEMLFITLDREQSEARKLHDGDLTCMTCNRQFGDKESLCDHVRCHIIEDASDAGTVPSDDASQTSLDIHQSHPCPDCDKAFADAAKLRQHVSRMHNGERTHTCDLCTKSFFSASDLARHEQTQHSTEKPFACWQCGKTFGTKGTLRTHLFSHLEVKPFTCEVCGRGFVSNALLVSHARVHTGTKPYKCSMCEKSYRMKCSLTYHEFTHAVKGRELAAAAAAGDVSADVIKMDEFGSKTRGRRPQEMACPVCQKIVHGSTEMRLHLKCHSGERPFQCNLCDISFKSIVTLQKHHERKHTDNSATRFPCDRCEKSYVTKYELQVHARAHAGERGACPFECNECGKTFQTQSNLNLHRQQHTSNTERRADRPYLCPIAECEQSFRNKTQLSMHYNGHTREEKHLLIQRTLQEQETGAAVKVLEDSVSLNDTINMLAEAGAELHRQSNGEQFDLAEISQVINSAASGEVPYSFVDNAGATSIGEEEIIQEQTGDESDTATEKKENYDLQELSELAAFLANTTAAGQVIRLPSRDGNVQNLDISSASLSGGVMSTVDTSQLNVSGNYLSGIPIEHAGITISPVKGITISPDKGIFIEENDNLVIDDCNIEEVEHTEEIATVADFDQSAESEPTTESVDGRTEQTSELSDEELDQDDEDDEYFAQMDEEGEEEEEEEDDNELIVDTSLEYLDDDASQPGLDVAMQAQYDDCNIHEVVYNEEIISTTTEPHVLRIDSNVEPTVEIEKLDDLDKLVAASSTGGGGSGSGGRNSLSTFVKFDFSGGAVRAKKRPAASSSAGSGKPSKRAFKCGNCAYETTTSKQLVAHQRTHAELCCSHCDAVFPRTKELATHQRLHSGEKPFQCTDCERSFATQEYLAAHMFLKHKHRTARKETTKRPIVARESGKRPIGARESGKRPIGAKETRKGAIVAKEATMLPIGEKEAKNEPIEAKEVRKRASEKRTPKLLKSTEDLLLNDEQKNTATSAQKKGTLRQQSSPFICPECERPCRDKTDLRRHISTHNKSAALKRKKSPEKKPDTTTTIDAEPTPSKKTKVSTAPAENPFAKPPRSKRLPATDWLALDSDIALLKTAARPTSKPYRCTVCPKSFAEQIQLQYHMIYHIPQKFPEPTATGGSPMTHEDERLHTTRASRAHDKEERQMVENRKQKALKRLQQAKQVKVKAMARKEGKHQCQVCGEVFALVRSLVVHKRSAHTDEASRNSMEHRCLCCDRTFALDRSLKAHMKKSHAGEVTADGDYVCKTCERTFPSKKRLSMHMEAAHSEHTDKEGIECTVCEHSFGTIRELKLHVKNKHPITDDVGGDVHGCTLCGRTFPSELGLKVHTKKLHGAAVTTDVQTKKLHGAAIAAEISAESAEDLVETDGKSQKPVSIIAGVPDTSVNPTNVPCGLCDRSFTSDNAMRIHAKKSHTVGHQTDIADTSRLHRCEVCERTFPSDHRLKVHTKKAHTDTSVNMVSSGEPPAFLEVGTAISARFKGAFCEARVKSVRKNIKCKVRFQVGGVSAVVSHKDISGDIKLEASVLVKQADRRARATIEKITDNSFYTAVFNDGDERILRRTSVCLMGERHFQEKQEVGFKLSKTGRLQIPSKEKIPMTATVSSPPMVKKFLTTPNKAPPTPKKTPAESPKKQPTPKKPVPSVILNKARYSKKWLTSLGIRDFSIMSELVPPTAVVSTPSVVLNKARYSRKWLAGLGICDFTIRVARVDPVKEQRRLDNLTRLAVTLSPREQAPPRVDREEAEPTVDDDEPVELPQPVAMTTSTKFACTMCPERFDLWFKLRMHLLKHQGDPEDDILSSVDEIKQEEDDWPSNDPMIGGSIASIDESANQIDPIDESTNEIVQMLYHHDDEVPEEEVPPLCF